MNLLKFVLILVSFASGSNLALAQEGPVSPRVTAEGPNVKISYGQPSKRERVIFGKLIPYGQVWRTGANEATEITFTKNAFFGGKPVKAGTYTLLTIPGNKTWIFILNSELGQWGASSYDANKNKNVLQVTVPASNTTATVERLTIALPAGKLVLEWDKTRVEVPIKS
jgi:hypothetical protein